MGPHGSGKSTLLASIDAELRDKFSLVIAVRPNQIDEPSRPVVDRRCLVLPGDLCRHRWREVSRWISRVPRDADRGSVCLVVDGIEQLGPLQRWWIRRRIVRAEQCLLATAHRPMAGLVILLSTQPCGRRLRQLTDWLLRDVDEVVRQTVWRHLKGADLDRVQDVREFWFELYDVVQSIDGRTAIDSVPTDIPGSASTGELS
ncbi:MAG: hypothetical protein AAGA03_09015 [Planctomycetota bacterium]